MRRDDLTCCSKSGLSGLGDEAPRASVSACLKATTTGKNDQTTGATGWALTSDARSVPRTRWYARVVCARAPHNTNKKQAHTRAQASVEPLWKILQNKVRGCVTDGRMDGRTDGRAYAPSSPRDARRTPIRWGYHGDKRDVAQSRALSRVRRQSWSDSEQFGDREELDRERHLSRETIADVRESSRPRFQDRNTTEPGVSIRAPVNGDSSTDRYHSPVLTFAAIFHSLHRSDVSATAARFENSRFQICAINGYPFP